MGGLEAGLGKAAVVDPVDPVDPVDAGDLIRADSWRVDLFMHLTPIVT